MLTTKMSRLLPKIIMQKNHHFDGGFKSAGNNENIEIGLKISTMN